MIYIYWGEHGTKRFFKGYTGLGWGSGMKYFSEQISPFYTINVKITELT